MSTIPIKRGNTLDLPMQVTKDGAPFDLTGKTLVYLLKAAKSDSDDDAALSFTVGDGLSLVSAATGFFKLTATAEEMSLTRRYYYGALQIRDNTSGAIIELPEDEVCDVWELTGQLIFATN